MTRAEAIEILKQLRLDYVEFWEETNNQYVKAYNMAIASLETDEAYQLEYEQPEFCADCISRAEVLKLMKDNWHTHNGDWAMQESLDDIRALPSVTPQEPKAGYWTHDGSHWENRFICSECDYKLFDEPTNYCPNCGCAMVEPQESEVEDGRLSDCK